MRARAWRVAAVSLLTGLTIGVPGVERAAGDEARAVEAAMLDDGPARRAALVRVELVASAARSGRTRLEGAVRNDYGRTARNVQLRISVIDAAGEIVSTVTGPTLESVPGQGEAHFEIPVSANPHAYRVAVAAFSFDFAEPAVR